MSTVFALHEPAAGQALKFNANPRRQDWFEEPAPQRSLLEERQHRREQLAIAFRLFARHGLHIGMAGHITARDPEWSDHFWVDPLGINFSQIKVSDLLLVNSAGEIVVGQGPLNRAAFAIHAALHEARPDIVAAAHTHSTYGKAWSTLGRLLDPLTQDACAFYQDHALFEDYSGALINALRVEPELGSPARGGLPATTARQTPEGWRVSGRKLYSTGSPILSWYALWTRTDEEQPRVGYLLVPAGLAGIHIEETWDHLGLRASGSHDVVFDDVLVPLENAVDLRLPAEWAGADPLAQAEIAVLISALYTGVAEAARDWLLEFLHARKPSSLGASLASLPRAQEHVGRIEGLLLNNQRLIGGLASDLDEGRSVSANESGLIKSLCTNHAVQVVELAQSLTSNHGLTRHNPLERHWRDVLCGRIHTPQDDSVWVTAGRKALGL